MTWRAPIGSLGWVWIVCCSCGCAPPEPYDNVAAFNRDRDLIQKWQNQSTKDWLKGRSPSEDPKVARGMWVFTAELMKGRPALKGVTVGMSESALPARWKNQTLSDDDPGIPGVKRQLVKDPVTGCTVRFIIADGKVASAGLPPELPNATDCSSRVFSEYKGELYDWMRAWKRKHL